MADTMYISLLDSDLQMEAPAGLVLRETARPKTAEGLRRFKWTWGLLIVVGRNQPQGRWMAKMIRAG